MRKDGKYLDEKQLNFEALDSQEQFAQYEVLFDPISRKCNVRGNMTVGWTDGTDDHLSVDVQYTFDGEVFQSWNKAQPGKEMPSAQTYGDGQISTDLADSNHYAQSFFTANGLGQGVMPGVPGFIITHTYSLYASERICDVFERWEKENRIDSLKMIEGKIEITARVEVLQGSSDFFLRVIYDPATDTIEKGQVFSRFKGREHVMDIYEVTFRVNEQGLRVPESSKIIMPLDKRAIIVSYSSFRFEDKLPEESFRLVFPERVRVEDFTNQNVVADKMRRENILRYTLMGVGIFLIVFGLGKLLYDHWKI
jgi:hypothetical protein